MRLTGLETAIVEIRELLPSANERTTENGPCNHSRQSVRRLPAAAYSLSAVTARSFSVIRTKARGSLSLTLRARV